MDIFFITQIVYAFRMFLPRYFIGLLFSAQTALHAWKNRREIFSGLAWGVPRSQALARSCNPQRPFSLKLRPSSRGLLSHGNQSYLMLSPWAITARRTGEPRNRSWHVIFSMFRLYEMPQKPGDKGMVKLTQVCLSLPPYVVIVYAVPVTMSMRKWISLVASSWQNVPWAPLLW